MAKKYANEKLDLNKIKEIIKVKKSELSDLEERLNSSECNYNVGTSKISFISSTLIEALTIFCALTFTYTATDLFIALPIYFVGKSISILVYNEDFHNIKYNCMIQKYFSLIKSKIKKSNCERKIKKLSNDLKYLEIDLEVDGNQINETKGEAKVLENEPVKGQTRDIGVPIKAIETEPQKNTKIYPNGDFSHYFDSSIEEEKGPTLTKRR